jgi:hypothetical protein
MNARCLQLFVPLARPISGTRLPAFWQEATMNLLLWPLVALWRVATSLVVLTGRLVAILLGLTLLIVGAVLTATIIGAIVGIPLLIVGLLLLARGLF